MHLTDSRTGLNAATCTHTQTHNQSQSHLLQDPLWFHFHLSAVVNDLMTLMNNECLHAVK